MFEQEVNKANVLLLNKAEVRYFGILAYGMKKKFMTQEEIAELIGISVAGFTDGVSITYVIDDAVTFKQLIGITGHEVTHVISNHLSRRESRVPELWNLACDHVVNRLWKKIASNANFVQLPEHHVFFEDLHREQSEITAEETYRYLEKNTKISHESDSCSGSGAGKPGSGRSKKPGSGGKRYHATIKRDKSGNKYVEVTDTQTGKKYKAALDTQPENVSAQTAERATADLISKARMLWDSNVISKGDLPGEIVDYIDDILEVKIAWEEVLEVAIMYFAQTQDLPSWSKKNIYIRNVRLPGYMDGFDTQVLVCCIDSSGSISNSDLKKFVGVILSSIKHFKKLRILVHDVDVHQEFVLDNEPNQDDILRTLREIKGRGGTSHKPVFDRIEILNREELISAAIFLTDYWSDVEEIYKKFEWIKEVPSVWVLNSDSNDTKNVILEDCETRTIHIK